MKIILKRGSDCEFMIWRKEWEKEEKNDGKEKKENRGVLKGI